MLPKQRPLAAMVEEEGRAMGKEMVGGIQAVHEAIKRPIASGPVIVLPTATIALPAHSDRPKIAPPIEVEEIPIGIIHLRLRPDKIRITPLLIVQREGLINHKGLNNFKNQVSFAPSL